MGNRTLTCLMYDSSHDTNNYRFIELFIYRFIAFK